MAGVKRAERVRFVLSMAKRPTGPAELAHQEGGHETQAVLARYCAVGVLNAGDAYVRRLVEAPCRDQRQGDFVAGVFAPTAFLCLVLGYMRQVEELWAQAHELEKLGASADSPTRDFQSAALRGSRT
jgi:hypothetical protein